MREKQFPEWRVRALQDINLPEKQVNILIHGPKSLTDAWFLAAMKFKYGQIEN